MRALSRKTANRNSTLRNLATSLILYERIKTTMAKAKEVKPIVEKLINSARKVDLTARRKLLAYLFDENAAKKVLEDILPRYKNIQTGFIQSYKLNPRQGDGAEMMILALAPGEKPQIDTVLTEKSDNKIKGKNAQKQTIKQTGKASGKKSTVKAGK